jgi:hypothetical protein
VHSNVDPLSCLPQIPPHDSPIRDNIKHIEPEPDKVEIAQRVEDKMLNAPAKKAAFIVGKWEDIVIKTSYKAGKNRRNASSKPRLHQAMGPDSDPPDNLLPLTPLCIQLDNWTYSSGIFPPNINPSEDWNKCSHLLVFMNMELIKDFS